MKELAQYLADNAINTPYGTPTERTMFELGGFYVDAEFYSSMGNVRCRINHADEYGIELSKEERSILQDMVNHLIPLY